MLRTLLIAAAIGVAAAALIEGRVAAAGDLVPGGLLEPTPLPATPAPRPPAAAAAAGGLVAGGALQPIPVPQMPSQPSAAAEPVERDRMPEPRRPILRSRTKARRPATAPEAVPADGKVRF